MLIGAIVLITLAHPGWAVIVLIRNRRDELQRLVPFIAGALAANLA